MPSDVEHTIGLACFGPNEDYEVVKIPLIPMESDVVQFDVHYCGICHSDVHSAKGEWCPDVSTSHTWPYVGGHEVLGVVTAVGTGVTKFKVGDRIGVGCFVDSCGDREHCEDCRNGTEQFCPKCVFTYNSNWESGRRAYGGYRKVFRVKENYGVHIPANLESHLASVCCCAAITTYNALKHGGMTKPGMKVGVVGCGGLGMQAIKLAAAFGCHVTAISTSPHKEEDCRKFGASAFLLSTDKAANEKQANTLDGIVDTFSSMKNFNDYFSLLKHGGKLVTVGMPDIREKLAFHPSLLIMKEMSLIGSVIGGVCELQECLEFIAKKKTEGAKEIEPTVEVITKFPEDVNHAYKNMNKAKYRYVLNLRDWNPDESKVTKTIPVFNKERA